MSVGAMETAGNKAAAGRRRLAGHAAVYTLATAAPALATLLVIPIITRVLPKSEYDIVALGNAVILVAMIGLALGMAAAITREYILGDAGPEGARGLVVQASGISLAMALLVLGTGRLWAPLLLGRPWDHAIAMAVLAALGGSVVMVVQSYLRGAGRPVPFVLLAAGGTLFGPTAGLLISLRVPTATAYLAAVAAGYLVAAIIGLLVVWADGPRAPTMRGLRQGLRIGLPTVPHQAALNAAMSGLVLVATRVLESGGAANIVLTIGAGATMLTSAVNNVWAPIVYRAQPAERYAVLTSTTQVIYRLTCAVVVVVCLGSSVLVQLASPAAFGHDAMIPAVAVAALAAVPSVPYLANSHLLFAHGRTGMLAITTPLSIAVALALGIVLARAMGLVGIGLAYVVAYSLLALLTTLAQRRLSRVPWRPPIPLAPLSTVIVAALVGALAGTNLWWVVARGALALILTVFLLHNVARTLQTRKDAPA